MHFNPSSDQPQYCEHFQHLKHIKKINIQSEAACKFCFSSKNNIWVCLHKNCGLLVCAKNQFLHLNSHLQESKKNKAFHCIFMNISTAQIRCQSCQIQIIDLQQLSEQQRKKFEIHGELNDPLKFRYQILPILAELGQPKLMGQLQFPQGHRRINKGLVGIFSTKYNYSLISAIQFLSHIEFLKDIVLSIKLNEYLFQYPRVQSVLFECQRAFQALQEAAIRAIRIDKLYALICKNQDYKRKDPFQYIFQILNLFHEQLIFFKVSHELQHLQRDQWDLFYKPNQIQSHCPIYDSLTSVLNMSYTCKNCQNQQSLMHPINFIKLNFPKKRKQSKIIEQELTERGYESPKKRRSSLMSFILPQEELPITIIELLIQFLKQPIHKQKMCSNCNHEEPMKPKRVYFQKLANLLIFQINRMPKTTDIIDTTKVLLDYNNINLQIFTKPDQKRKDIIQKMNNQSVENIYQLQTALCVEDNGLFPVLSKSRYNKQMYVFKNEIVQMTKEKFNPYLLCYKKKSSKIAEKFYQEVTKSKIDLEIYTQPNKIISFQEEQNIKQSQISEKKSKKFERFQRIGLLLPDFYHIQLKHGIQFPLYHQLVCKHSRVKPEIQMKCKQTYTVDQQLYQKLVDTYRGVHYCNIQCQECSQEIKLINQRKLKQKILMKQYDRVKIDAYCMISIIWLKKWSNYLYKKEKHSYFHKGFPFPPPIQNKCLLQGNQCKKNLVKNKDFKVINILIFKFLKQLYGGGPQIRYKWKNEELSSSQQQLIRIAKQKANQLKLTYQIWPQSPKKTFIIQKKSSSYVQTINQEQMEDFTLDSQMEKSQNFQKDKNNK